jgi:type II secretory pathway pseudopilin PulG
VAARAGDEQGFGLIELLFAMVMLNIGILALVAAFQSGAVALSRSSAVSNGAAVADKTMEVYRGLQSCAVYLDAPASGGSDVGGLPNGIPNSTSTWYAKYSADTSAYASSHGTSYFSYGGTTPWWATNPAGSTTYTGIPTSLCSTPTLPSGSPDPKKAVQYVAGPDGQSYPVFTYIVVTSPSGASWSAGEVKQVTVTVLNPRNTSQVLARETSYFDPNVTG